MKSFRSRKTKCASANATNCIQWKKNCDLESFATEVSEFERKALSIPEASCYQLTDLRYALIHQMSLLKSELKSATEAFLSIEKSLTSALPFAQPESLSILKNGVIKFSNEKLTSLNDTIKSPSFRGALPVSYNSEEMYLLDRDNSKIKMLNLKTSQLEEVQNSHVYLHSELKR